MKTAVPAKNEVTIIGFLEEIEEDETTRMVIVTDDGDYVVEPNIESNRLYYYVDHDIKAAGFVTTDKRGVKHIAVSDFEVVEPGDDVDDYPDDYFSHKDEENNN